MKVCNEHPRKTRRLERKKSKSKKRFKSKSSEQDERYKDLGYSWGNVDLAPYVQVRNKIPHAVTEHGSLSYISKSTLALKKQIKKLKELKTLLSEHHGKLLFAVDKLLQLATRYYNETKDLPFDWMGKNFLQRDKRGWKISYPDINMVMDHLLILPPPEVINVESDDDECEIVKRSLKDPKLSRLGELSLVIPRDSECQYVIKKPGFFCPLNEKEMEIWGVFKDYEKETPEAEVINPNLRLINVNHPVVAMLGVLAVEIFNTLCEKFVKKGVHNNLHDIDIMECNYVKDKEVYHFYMIIEAVEEGKRGTYLAQVMIKSLDGAITLSKFALTDHKPCGVGALAGYYVFCLTAVWITMHDMLVEKQSRLRTISQILKADEKNRAMSEISYLEGLYREAVHGAEQRLTEDTQTFLPLHIITNPDGWSSPDPDFTGMVRRAKNTTCTGYDYCNPFFRTLRVSNMKSSNGRNKGKKWKNKLRLMRPSWRRFRAFLHCIS